MSASSLPSPPPCGLSSVPLRSMENSTGGQEALPRNRPRRVSMRRWMRSGLDAASAMALAILASISFAIASQAQADEFRTARIQVADVGSEFSSREFYGRVVALETVDLAFQVGGQIVEFPLREGELVPEGSLIAALDLVPLELALAQAEAELTRNTRTLDRMEQLSGSAVSQATVDDARTDAEISAIEVASARRSLEQGTLLAPFDALVSSRLVANHTTITAGTPVVRLHDMSEVRIEINVPEVLFQSAGRAPNVALFARFPSSDTRYPVEIREYNAETATIGQTYTITLGMAPPEDLIVLPGSSAVIEAEVGNENEILIIPRSALVFASDGEAQVMLFEPTGADVGTVRLQPITIAPSDNGDVIVVSGLTSDQEFISAGGSQLIAGETVQRFRGFGQ